MTLNKGDKVRITIPFLTRLMGAICWTLEFGYYPGMMSTTGIFITERMDRSYTYEIKSNNRYFLVDPKFVEKI